MAYPGTRRRVCTRSARTQELSCGAASEPGHARSRSRGVLAGAAHAARLRHWTPQHQPRTHADYARDGLATYPPARASPPLASQPHRPTTSLLLFPRPLPPRPRSPCPPRPRVCPAPPPARPLLAAAHPTGKTHQRAVATRKWSGLANVR